MGWTSPRSILAIIARETPDLSARALTLRSRPARGAFWRAAASEAVRGVPSCCHYTTRNRYYGAMLSHVVRDATPADAERCREIYAPYVESTAITFEESAPDTAEMERRIATPRLGHAWLVLEEAQPDGAGQNPRLRLRGPLRQARRLPLGRRGELLTSSRARPAEAAAAPCTRRCCPASPSGGFRVAMACMTLPNDASVGLHEALGFEQVGTLCRHRLEARGLALGRLDAAPPLPAAGDPAGPPSELR